MMCVFFYEDTTGILNFRVRACSACDVSYYNDDDDDDDDDDDKDDEMMTILFVLSFRFSILSSSLVAFFIVWVLTVPSTRTTPRRLP
jgi:hypothetical protein